jgi:hypothetical protein
LRRTTARLQDAAMTGDPDPTKAAQWLACTINAGLVAGAVCAVVAEGWDLNRDGAFTVHEALLVLVRLLAFPVHVLLQLTPAPVLQLLGLPDAPWPSSAAVAVALSLPLWGVLISGVLVVEAWLEMAWAAAGRHKHEVEKARLAERPPGP